MTNQSGGFTSQLLMVRPAHFGYNVETAQNNVFQTKPTIAESVISLQAQSEFDDFVETIRKHDISVEVWQDNGEKIKPDAVFPNNWISFHEDGTIITYPMYAENRRWERSAELVEAMAAKFSFQNFIGFEDYENQEMFLEGTGSMVLDRENRICYACFSRRTDDELLAKWCDLMDYKMIGFDSIDQDQNPIYHTNVMMAVGPKVVVICKESIPDEVQWEMIEKSILESGKSILPISFGQMADYAGNMLFVRNNEGADHVIVSKRAWNSLDPNQQQILEDQAVVIQGKIDAIETIGGGSVRCMLAEVFLPIMD